MVLLFALCFHQETFIGAKKGLILWYQTVIPSLLPFILITNALSETQSHLPALAFISKLLPGKAHPIFSLFLGNLCGYPLGGKIINDFVKSNLLPSDYANTLLAVCSQASPMFLIGYVHYQILNESIPLFVFLAAIYIPNIILFVHIIRKKQNTKNVLSFSKNKPLLISDTFFHSVQIITMIGIYMIIFSILFEILFPHCNYTITKILLSCSEITTGINILSTLPMSEGLQVASVGALSTFGGISSALQIKYVLTYPNASIKKYLLHKIILAAGTFCILYSYYLFRIYPS